MTGNMTTKPAIVIAGGGLSALMMARMIRLYRDPAARIIIVEKEDSVGGQYGSYDYGEYGYFDIGMHIYYESCIPEIDDLFTGLLPEEEWHILEGNHKYIQGLFYNGRLQEDTPCVDLRNLPEEQWKRYTADLMLAIRREKDTALPEHPSAYDVLQRHFGKILADEIFVPVLDKLYLEHPSGLDELATLFTPLTRVALYEADQMLDLMKSEQVRSRIAYPDQLSLPPYRTNPYRGFYPKQFGMFRVMEKLKQVIEAEGTSVLTSSSISDLALDGERLKSVVIRGKDGNETRVPVQELYWAAGLPSLAKALDLEMSDLVYDKKQTEAMYINLLFDKMPEMGKLYYFFCFDKGYRSFRVTQYSNYCPGAAGQRGYPLCVEWWAQPGDSPAEEDILRLVLDELRSFTVINNSHTLKFAKVEKLKGFGFPLPSVRNISNMKTIGDRIRERGISNIIPTGVLSGKNVFFIKEVLIDTYQKVMNRKPVPAMAS